jgi:nucleoside-diphosphate-sugar epimerase
VDANLSAAESASAIGQVINIANGQRVTINEVFDKVKKLTSRPEAQAEYAPPRAGDVRDSLADLSLARSLLAYNPQVGLEEGLRLTIDWWTSSRFSQAAR